MRDRLLDGLVQGDRLAWGLVAVLWLVATAIALVHRPEVPGPPPAAIRTRWSWVELGFASVLSLLGLTLANALAIPRLRWAPAPAGSLIATSTEGWRKLRGPAAFVTLDADRRGDARAEVDDLAVPTLDGEGNWTLVGMLSGEPIPRLPFATPGTIKPGAPRVCLADGDECRPWPEGWPDPTRPVAPGDFVWTSSSLHGDGGPPLADALAYDIESARYLRLASAGSASGDHAEGGPAASPDAPILELVGRLGTEAPKDDSAMLFVLRRLAKGRLRAVRLLASQAAGGGHTYQLQRMDVSLTTGRRALRFVRPLLWATSFSLPVGLLLALVLARATQSTRGEGSRAFAWIEATATLLLGVAVAAPAAVALATLLGSR